MEQTRYVEPVSHATLVDLLGSRAHHQASRTAYTFLADGESEEVSISYAELDEKARSIAAYLHDAGACGSRALLLYPSGLDYILAFFGCLYAGVVPVPAYPPRKNRSLDRIDGIVINAEATHVLGTTQILNDVERRFSEHPHLQQMHRIATDTLDLAAAPTWSPTTLSGADLAFLQYTSGSTDRPKGVMVSHDNLMHNQRLMHQAFQLTEQDRLLGWLPLYHDMGLIGNVLHSLYAGVHCVLMAPVMFLQKPVRWLNGVTKYGATISGGPNFAYDLCSRKITPEQREGLDLSSWNLAVNGSEPIRAATLELFSETFSPHGFRRNAFFPCYGLAEATLFVSGGPVTNEPTFDRVGASALAENRIERAGENGSSQEETCTLVSSGTAWPDQQLQIVNPETMTPCASGEVGEILISGGSVAGGYWKAPEATKEAFEAIVANGSAGNGSNGSHHALRTGDLGFIREGELFVTGRIKDMIIIRGRNHYPQDIEATVAAAHPALRGGGAAAFSIEIDHEERLAVVQEVERTAVRNLDEAGIVGAIRKAVSDAHELHAHTVVLLKPGHLPRTTSGKIQRRKCKGDLVAGRLEQIGGSGVATDAPAPTAGGYLPLTHAELVTATPGERSLKVAGHLQQLIARARKVAPNTIDKAAPLSAFGLDSLDMTELKVTIENDLRLVAPPLEAIQDASIDELAAHLADQMSGTAGTGGSLGDGANGAPPAPSQATTDLFAKCDTDGGYFGKYRLADDKYFTQPVLEGPIGPRMQFDGKEVIVWSINNYLGLARNPVVHDAARAAIEEHGTWSPMGSRLLTGNTRRHMALEAKLARHLGKESSIVFNFGYMGVIGTINAVVEENDTVIIDSLSHACIVDGALLASRGKQFRVFRHNDVESLEDQLRAANMNRRGGVLVVTEGLFGMTGDQAPLPEICKLKERYDARLFIDDAHGFGVMGATGAGTAEHQGVQDQIDLYFGTFAKSFAAIGGVTAGDKKVVDYIRYNARPNVFAKSLPMVYVEAVDAALELVENGEDARAQVWHIAQRLQRGLVDLGYEVGATSSPITPVYVPAGDEETAVTAMRLMRSTYGVFVSAVTYPVVPRGVVLFRLTSTAAHTDEDVDQTLEAFRNLKEHLNLEPAAQQSSVS